MQEFDQIFNNHILIVSIAACLFAQFLKLIIELVRHRKVNLRYLVTTGGMPSAHSALVSSLATGVGLKEGWDSPIFAIACLFAVIVMYDAAGVRQAAGKQARILNQILDGFFQDGKEVNEERLKELLGHTPFQVLVGLALGVGFSLVAAPAL
ncbi:divergent PAP2 family protein [Chroococcus sp. FPU101]|uniref:divergent PAP2 family protein n=1 Tax=Chroococcus sp. FPU101 TaxID=1974212 RepID=UPI001A8F34A9|nr:divergent PAP2 family protein [Chroococcus sp. FPU101]GFE70728.1 acid phosphatase/vanadium-dependent haloperoxidase related [Chroococcus sp. FPU101]